MDQWLSASFFNQNVRKIQLPFSPSSNEANANGKSEEKDKLRRQKQGQRLQELNARRRDKMVMIAIKFIYAHVMCK